MHGLNADLQNVDGYIYIWITSSFSNTFKWKIRLCGLISDHTNLRERQRICQTLLSTKHNGRILFLLEIVTLHFPETIKIRKLNISNTKTIWSIRINISLSFLLSFNKIALNPFTSSISRLRLNASQHTAAEGLEPIPRKHIVAKLIWPTDRQGKIMIVNRPIYFISGPLPVNFLTEYFFNFLLHQNFRLQTSVGVSSRRFWPISELWRSLSPFKIVPRIGATVQLPRF